MTVEAILTHLALANVAGALAVLLVLSLRNPARRWIGARGAYAQWLIVPAIMVATLAPARTVWRALPAPMAAPAPVQSLVEIAPPPAAGPIWRRPSSGEMLLGGWLAGAAGFVLFILYGQYRAVATFGLIGPDRRGCARAANLACGPALIGLIRPRIVLPADFEARFTPGEQDMILAHEGAHLAAGHLWINALTGLVRSINWFNPLIHLAAYYARVDQELACDAAVVERFPGERRTYAKAMLKTQLASAPLPLGCYWPGGSTPLLKERIEMLAQHTPSRLRLAAGAVLIAVLAVGGGLAAWSAQPPVVKMTPAASSAKAAPAALSASPVTAGDVSLGSATAPVTVVEYASVACPYCARFGNDVFPAFKAKYVDTGQVRFVMREMLTHNQQWSAAGFLLARCAGQDQYFNVVEEEFRDRDAIEQSGDIKGGLARIARDAGLSQTQFNTCVSDPKAIAALNARVQQNTSTDGISSTPTLVVNGKPLNTDGLPTLADLDKAIAQARDEAAAKSPLARICATNAIDNKTCFSSLADASKGADKLAPGAVSPNAPLDQQSPRVQEMVRMAQQLRPGSSLPRGQAVELNPTLTAANGAVITFGKFGFAGKGVPFNDGTDPAYIFGASAVADNDGLTIRAGVSVNGQVMMAPPVTLASGASSTVTLADGSRLTLAPVTRAARPSDY